MKVKKHLEKILLLPPFYIQRHVVMVLNSKKNRILVRIAKLIIIRFRKKKKKYLIWKLKTILIEKYLLSYYIYEDKISF